MSTDNGNRLQLEGTGAAYIRISDKKQETERQYAAAHAFEKRHGVTIPKDHWLKDEGLARDEADRRPEFQRLLKLAEAGRVQWIVVAELDRFGTKNARQLNYYLYRLEEAGCRLYDAQDKDWTAPGLETQIMALFKGEGSKEEQAGKSHRALGGMVERAKKGEYLGGPVRLGMDIACYRRDDKAEPPTELWRVVLLGFDRRLKRWPDGREERFDGRRNFPAHQKETEMLRLTPSKDQAKLDAVKRVFQDYATQAVSTNALAEWLTNAGFRNTQGGYFQGRDIGRLLADPIYMGYPTWNKEGGGGKFRCYKGGQVIPVDEHGKEPTRNAKEDWVQSERLFPPLIGQETWIKVKAKLAKYKLAKDKKKRGQRPAGAPRSLASYLSTLVRCAGCGSEMSTTGPPKCEYYCRSWHIERRTKGHKKSPCRRNGVRQDKLMVYVERYLEDVGVRLELLIAPPAGDPRLGQLKVQEGTAWAALDQGLGRLFAYLAQHHPAEYNAIVAYEEARQDKLRDELKFVGPPPPKKKLPPKGQRRLDEAIAKAAREPYVDTSYQGDRAGDFVEQCIAAYQARHDPAALADQIKQRQAELVKLTAQWADLPTKRAKDLAAQRLQELEAQLDELEGQQQDLTGLIQSQYRELLALWDATAAARAALALGQDERALRYKAHKLQEVIYSIECKFKATGRKGKGGAGAKHSDLVSVTFYPVGVDDPRTYQADQAPCYQLPAARRG
jgi:DNA invertase Pin-like site-specific DNA recombinase